MKLVSDDCVPITHHPNYGNGDPDAVKIVLSQRSGNGVPHGCHDTDVLTNDLDPQLCLPRLTLQPTGVHPHGSFKRHGDGIIWAINKHAYMYVLEFLRLLHWCSKTVSGEDVEENLVEDSKQETVYLNGAKCVKPFSLVFV